jgi:glucose-1-phosphate thymidylyltransferase
VVSTTDAESAITVGENVHVMADARVDGGDLDRSLVFPGATVEDCALRNSLVDSEATVRDLDLSGALIGAHTQIENER